MKIVNKKKFIRSIIIIGIILFISFILINNTLSHNEISYKTIYISSGDTLWGIAKQEKNCNIYFEDKDIRTIVDEIKHTNGLNKADLIIGQKLNIPTI